MVEIYSGLLVNRLRNSLVQCCIYNASLYTSTEHSSTTMVIMGTICRSAGQVQGLKMNNFRQSGWHFTGNWQSNHTRRTLLIPQLTVIEVPRAISE
jgi:hypothetical protein